MKTGSKKVTIPVMVKIKKLPANLFRKVYGKYVPRLCVDVAVIGPHDIVKFKRMKDDLTPVFSLSGKHGIALKERTEQPGKGQWGLPGGTVFKSERLEEAAKRIIKNDLGLEINVLGFLGVVEFPNEKRQLEIGGLKKQVIIDSISVVVLARAHSDRLSSPKGKAEWFKTVPPVEHGYHTPFLKARGLLA